MNRSLGSHWKTKTGSRHPSATRVCAPSGLHLEFAIRRVPIVQPIHCGVFRPFGPNARLLDRCLLVQRWPLSVRHTQELLQRAQTTAAAAGGGACPMAVVWLAPGPPGLTPWTQMMLSMPEDALQEKGRCAWMWQEKGSFMMKCCVGLK